MTFFDTRPWQQKLTCTHPEAVPKLDLDEENEKKRKAARFDKPPEQDWQRIERLIQERAKARRNVR